MLNVLANKRDKWEGDERECEPSSHQHKESRRLVDD